MQTSKLITWIKGVPVKSHCAEIKRLYENNKQGTENVRFIDIIKEPIRLNIFKTFLYYHLQI